MEGRRNSNILLSLSLSSPNQKAVVAFMQRQRELLHACSDRNVDDQNHGIWTGTTLLATVASHTERLHRSILHAPSQSLRKASSNSPHSQQKQVPELSSHAHTLSSHASAHGIASIPGQSSDLVVFPLIPSSPTKQKDSLSTKVVSLKRKNIRSVKLRVFAR